MRIFFFHNPRTLLIFSCLKLSWDKKPCASLAGHHCWQGEGMGSDSSSTEPCSARWQQEGGTDGSRLLSCGLHPYQGGQGEPCGYISLPAPSMQNSVPPVSPVQASLPDSAMAAELHRCWRSSIPRVESCFPFQWRRMVRESVLPLTEWSPATPRHRPKGEREPFSAGAFRVAASLTQLQDQRHSWIASACFGNFLSAFPEGSTAQGKEGCARLQVSGKTRLTLPVRPRANTLGRIYEPFRPAPQLFLETGPPNEPLLPPFFPFWICYVWLLHPVTGSPRNHLFPLLRIAQKNVCSTVWESCRWGLMKAIYRICIHIPTGSRTTVFSQWLSKDALWLSPAHSSTWAPLFSLTPTRHKVSHGCSGCVCQPDKSLEFLFYGTECIWYRKIGVLSNTYWTLFSDVYYLPVEWETLIRQVIDKHVALIHGIDYLLSTTPWFLSMSVPAGKPCTSLSLDATRQLPSTRRHWLCCCDYPPLNMPFKFWASVCAAYVFL